MKKMFLYFSIFLLCYSHKSESQTYGDYTLIAVQNQNSASLIDMSNTTYHSWTFGSTKKTGYSSYLQHDTLVRTVAYSGSTSPFSGGGMTGEVQKVAWDGTVIWDYTYTSSTYCMHHDICPMPNGNVLIIAYELKTAAELTAVGGSTSHSIWPDKIIEVQPTGATTGTIVWEWHMWDHLMQNTNSSLSNYYTTLSDHPELLNINYLNTSMTTDWSHSNGIDYNPALDQICLSSHNFNEIYVIDHSTTTAQAASHSGGNSGMGGDILYRWGNPAAYGASGTADFNVVHDAHWVKYGSHIGDLAGFNNNGVSSTVSCVDLFTPPYSGYTYTHTSGSAYGPATFSVRDTCTGHANDMSNSQQMPNGNTLICIATAGSIYEIDSNKNVIWTKSVSGTVPKAFRYTDCYIHSTLLTPTISQHADTLLSSLAGTYQWEKDGVTISGATSLSYVPSDTGFYSVQITDSMGCSGLSSTYHYTSAVTLINNINNSNYFSIFPNPTDGIIHIISNNGVNRQYQVMVYDITGRLILKENDPVMIDLSSCRNGAYYLFIKCNNKIESANSIIVNR